MVIDLRDVRNLRPRLPQIRLVKMARIVVEIGVFHLLFMSRRPWSVLARFLAAHLQPLLQQGNLLPHAIGKDLSTQSQLAVETANLCVLLHDVFPHVAHTAQLLAVIGANIERKIVPRRRDEAPVRFVSSRNKKLVARAAQMRRDGIGPLRRSGLLHLKVNVVPIERPALMRRDGDGFQLPGVGRQIDALVNMDRRRLRSVCDEKNGA